MSATLAYLGTLAATTTRGRRAVAASLTGAVELHHIVHSGLDVSNEAVSDWLWSMGINPDEAVESLPPEILIEEVFMPELKSVTLVVTHDDLDIPFVDLLVRALGRRGNPVIVSGLSPTGPLAEYVNGAAGRRAIALQAAYEAAIEQASHSPVVHHLTGTLDAEGKISSISIDGPFAKNSWTVSEEDDALFVAMALAPLNGFAKLKVQEGPAAVSLSRLAAQVGLEQSIAA